MSLRYALRYTVAGLGDDRYEVVTRCGATESEEYSNQRKQSRDIGNTSKLLPVVTDQLLH